MIVFLCVCLYVLVEVFEVGINPLSEDYTIMRSHILCNKVIYFGFNFLVQVNIGKYVMFGFGQT